VHILLQNKSLSSENKGDGDKVKAQVLKRRTIVLQLFECTVLEPHDSEGGLLSLPGVTQS
jgi:hypothetical protein